jgi:heme/copper-type cytochrome/quinol oxidase subunit 1
MKRLALTLIAVTALIAALLFGYAYWQHQVYTAGIDVNLKAYVVAGMAVVLAAVLYLVARQIMRSKRKL